MRAQPFNQPQQRGLGSFINQRIPRHIDDVPHTQSNIVVGVQWSVEFSAAGRNKGAFSVAIRHRHTDSGVHRRVAIPAGNDFFAYQTFARNIGQRPDSQSAGVFSDDAHLTHGVHDVETAAHFKPVSVSKDLRGRLWNVVDIHGQVDDDLTGVDDATHLLRCHGDPAPSCPAMPGASVRQ